MHIITRSPPRPIKTEAELNATQEMIDALIDSGEITPEKQDYLNVLGMLVHEYEEKYVCIPDIYGVEFLKVLLEEFEVDQEKLIAMFGNELILVEVLNGQRELTVEQINKLAKFFKISAAAFLNRS